MPMLSWLIAWPANQLELYLEWHMSKSVIFFVALGRTHRVEFSQLNNFP